MNSIVIFHAIQTEVTSKTLDVWDIRERVNFSIFSNILFIDTIHLLGQENGCHVVGVRDISYIFPHENCFK